MPRATLKSLLFILGVLAAFAVRAGWEDTGAPLRRTPPAGVRPAPRSRTSTPPPARRPPAAAPARAPAGVVPPDIYSTFLDTPVEPLAWVSMAYVGAAEVAGGTDDLATGELEARLNLARWRNLLAGDMDLDLRLRTEFFGGDGGFDIMPTALVALPLDLRWTWRFLDGTSFQVGAAPGIYADAEALGGEMFALPFHLAWYGVVTPRFSWMAGLEVRPAWDLPVMPLLGVAWEPSDFWRFELALPRSRAQFQVGPVMLFGAFAWRNTTYAMSGDDGDPDEMTTEDLLLSGGVQVRASDTLNLAAEVGMLMNRTLTAEGAAGEGELDLDDAPFVRLTFGGAF